MIILSEEQRNIHDYALSWINDKRGLGLDVLTIGGYAGTGKSTVLAELVKSLERSSIRKALVTFTGKASLVLREKMKQADAMFVSDSISTIHSLIYKPKIDRFGKLLGWSKLPVDEMLYDVIIIDEASMVSRQMFMDLTSYNIPILAVGDHGQLPPVSNDNFNLMDDPMLRLEEIHRQAKGNPIIHLSELARNGKPLPQGKISKNVVNVDYYTKFAKQVIDTYTPSPKNIMLCGMNRTRVKLNEMVRENRGFKGDLPNSNERLICLKNNKLMGIVNGQMGTLLERHNVNSNLMYADILLDGDKSSTLIPVYKHSFGLSNHEDVHSDIFQLKHEICKGSPISDFREVSVFEFGNAISVHKSQGSSWRFVVLFNERNSYQSNSVYAKWLYTAITRAESFLVIINNFI